MKVLHLNTWSHGSTGNIALAQHRALQRLGHESHFLVADNSISGDSTVGETKKPGKLGLFAKRGLRRFCSDFLWRGKDNDYLFDPQWGFAFPSVGEIVARTPFTPDLVVAYWANFLVHDRLLRELSERFQAPIFWYLMDMAPITGGCHYAFDCKGYVSKCGRCPGIVSSRGNDISRRRWLEKDANLRRTPLVFLAPSSQVLDQLNAGSISRSRPKAIVFQTVAPEVFSPEPRTDARKRFEAPEDAFVIFFGAQHLHEKRKGMGALLDALRILSDSLEPDARKSVFILYAGGGANLDLPFAGKYAGYLDRDGMADAFRAADVFACPSIEESGPLMINESLMSGTPVACFEMGVGRDLVHNGHTGYRAKLGDSDDLAKGLLGLLRLGKDERQAMRRGCREYALANVHPDVQARNVIALGEQYNYRTLCSGLSRVQGRDS